MSFFSSGPTAEIDQNDYDEEEQSKTGELDYYRDGLDDFQSDDVYDDEYDTSQNNQLNGRQYAGDQILDSRAELYDYSSADGEDQESVDRGGIEDSRDDDDHAIADCPMQIGNQSPSRAIITDGSFGSSENDNFREAFKTNKGHNMSSSVEPSKIPPTDTEAIQSIHHMEDPQIDSHSADLNGMTEEEVTALPEAISQVCGSSNLPEKSFNTSDNTTLQAGASGHILGLEATDPLETIPTKSGVGNDSLKRQIGATDLDAAADDDRAANLSRRQSGVQVRAAPGAGQSQGIPDGGMRQLNRKVDSTSQGLRRRFESVPKSVLRTQSARGSSTLLRPAVAPMPILRNNQNLALPITMSSPVNDSHCHVAVGQGSVLLRQGVSDLRRNDKRVPVQSTHAHSFNGSSRLMEEPAMQVENTLRSSTPSSMVLYDKEFDSTRRVDGPTVSEPATTLSSRGRQEYLPVQQKANSAYDRLSDTVGDSTVVQNHPEGNLRSSQVNFTGTHSSSVDDHQHRSSTMTELPNGKRSNYGARTERPSAPIARAGTNVPAAASAHPQWRGSSNAELESRIDAIISTTSKRLRDIQQDNGSSNFHEDGHLSSSNLTGGNQEASAEFMQGRSEGASAADKSKEKDCNVPAFVLALERDSLTLAGALCRLMSKDALLLAPLIFDAEKSLNSLRESLQS